jgi:hypothetical protein
MLICDIISIALLHLTNGWGFRRTNFASEGERRKKMDAHRNKLGMLRAAAVALTGFAMVCGLLILLGGPAQPAAAAPLAITVSGNINTNTVWRTSDSPVIVTGTVTVVAGTLTISPGVTVKFNNGTGLIIQAGGRLAANGTQPADYFYLELGRLSCAWESIISTATTTASSILLLNTQSRALIFLWI